MSHRANRKNTMPSKSLMVMMMKIVRRKRRRRRRKVTYPSLYHGKDHYIVVC